MTVTNGIGSSAGPDISVDLPATHAGYRSLVQDALTKLVESPAARIRLEANQETKTRLLSAIVDVVTSGAKLGGTMDLLRAAATMVQR